MENLKVLIADDDPNVCEIIRLYLEQNQVQVIEASNGNEAVQLNLEEKPDIIILDIMMPKMDGIDVCRHIRKETNVPIIMLTAKDEEVDRILGLEMGADDYVTKPFSPRELMARIKAILRRVAPEENNPKDQEAYSLGTLHVHFKRREVSIDGEIIAFRPKEFDLLTYFIRHPNDVLTREKLLEQVWGYDYFGDIRTVDVHIKKIREKLDKHGVECIHTVWGVGYRFEVIPPLEGKDEAQ